MRSSSDRMRRVGRRDTDCELRLRSHLHAIGLRYRVDYRVDGLRTKPDIAFVGARVAVFIDGCYWHGCPEHGTISKTNVGFWRKKIEGNRERDLRLTEDLTRAGWRVVRLWSHESLETMLERIRDALTR